MLSSNLPYKRLTSESRSLSAVALTVHRPVSYTHLAEITFLGYHSHIGSQIFDKQAYVAEIEKLMQFTKEI